MTLSFSNRFIFSSQLNDPYLSFFMIKSSCTPTSSTIFFFLIPVDFLNSFYIPVDQCFLSNSSYHNFNFGITTYEMTTTFTHTADFVLSPPNFEIPKDRTQEIEKVYEILSFLKITFGRSIQHFNAYGWVIFVFDTRCMWAQICGQ